MKRSLTLVALLAVLTPTVDAANITGIQVYPPDVHLSTALDFQRFVVIASRDDGVTVDVTQQATAKLRTAVGEK